MIRMTDIVLEEGEKENIKSPQSGLEQCKASQKENDTVSVRLSTLLTSDPSSPQPPDVLFNEIPRLVKQMRSLEAQLRQS